MNLKKIRRKMRRFIRRHRHHLALACVILLAALLVLMAAGREGKNGDYDDFLEALAMRESTDNDLLVNQYGYLGRYQMGRSALEDAGFRYEGGGWTELANSYGIYDQEDFLNSRDGQEAAVRAYHRKVCEYIRFYGLEEYIGKTYCGVTVTRSGLLAGCHLVGIGGLREGLESGEHVYDGNHTPAAEYMELFAGYDIAAVWHESD